ncbi:hypothetical protein M0R04_03800 [Candidatus Dojkabacteria bacterium]|jgi:hypothetical protein|nr:hypothetical protein [Candidatus Dojkabacteria bacterium]
MNDGKKNIREGSKTFDELRALQNTVKKFKFEDLIVPILSVIALTLLTIFVYVPMITTAISNRAESKATLAKITQLNKLTTDLNSIDLNNFNATLTSSRKVIPFSLQVSDFLSYVDDSAKKNGLVFKEILTGDITIINPGQKKGDDSITKGVSGPLKYQGNINQITNFLDELQATSPYIISADQISLKKSNSSTWEVALTVTGYYIDRSALPALNVYAPFTLYSQNANVIEIFNTKASKSN